MQNPPRIIKDNTLSCFQLAITSLAEQQGVQIDDIWYQAGFYFEDQGDDGFLIDSRYKPIEDQILNCYFEEHEFFDVGTCMDQVDYYLKQGNSLAVTVDNYELKHSNSYHNQHHEHLIEINKRMGEKYFVTDHFFHFQGEMTHEEIVSGVSSYLEQFKSLKINLCFLKNNQVEYTTHDLIQIIQETCTIMSGEKLFNVSLRGELGVNAFSIMTNKFLQCVNGDGQDEDEIDDWYNAFKEVGNSRYNFFRLLHRYYPTIDLSFITKASQNWISLGNMLLKAQYLNTWKAMNERIIKRFERTLSQEIENIHHLRNVLNSLCNSKQ
ncbi:hypothetical protein SAMN04488137_4665 [Fictibacillus solisalsi]|uniref:Butirosin biosynthesis protein H, N-terminal n=1 Tax=Fictibacillus solisalsi TaxID=459525 RepID=A0A1H0BTM3_9BACL|nr:hypothetical protein [Fictibacillus solisalsi]SDN48950.1 hypothetical protein SAMN04488137_4665 [Fictibacillus solisalsi]